MGDFWTPFDIPSQDEMSDFELRMVSFQETAQMVTEMMPTFGDIMKDSQEITEKLKWIESQPPLIQVGYLREIMNMMLAFEKKHSKFVYAMHAALKATLDKEEAPDK